MIPSRGFALPRREGAFGHIDGAPRMEVQFRIRRPEFGVEKIVIDGPGSDQGYQSAGVRLGDLLWLTSQVADPQYRAGEVAAEVDDVLQKLAAVAANAGTDVTNALRIRALFTRAADVPAFYDALRKVIPSDPPAVSAIVIPSALPVPDARVAIDGVVLVTE